MQNSTVGMVWCPECGGQMQLVKEGKAICTYRLCHNVRTLRDRIESLEADRENLCTSLLDQVPEREDRLETALQDIARLQADVEALKPQFDEGDVVVSKGRKMIVLELRDERYRYLCGPREEDPNPFEWVCLESSLSAATSEPDPEPSLEDRIKSLFANEAENYWANIELLCDKVLDLVAEDRDRRGAD